MVGTFCATCTVTGYPCYIFHLFGLCSRRFLEDSMNPDRNPDAFRESQLVALQIDDTFEEDEKLPSPIGHHNPPPDLPSALSAEQKQDDKRDVMNPANNATEYMQSF